MDISLKSKGLMARYNVIIQKADGTPVDEDARYFVLRYDNNGSDLIHTAACRKALRVYAEEIENHLPKLAEDLFTELLNFENKIG